MNPLHVDLVSATRSIFIAHPILILLSWIGTLCIRALVLELGSLLLVDLAPVLIPVILLSFIPMLDGAHFKICFIDVITTFTAIGVSNSVSMELNQVTLGLAGFVLGRELWKYLLFLLLIKRNLKKKIIVEFIYFELMYNLLLTDAAICLLFDHKDFFQGQITLDPATSKLVQDFARENLKNKRLLNSPIENLDFSIPIPSESIQQFVSETYGDDYTFSMVPQMDEIYATNFSASSGIDTDLTVQQVHCDGDLPNIFGFQTYRMLITVFSETTNTETVFFPSVRSKHLASRAQAGVCLHRPGEFMIFDYNAQPHSVKSVIRGKTNFRVFFKIHFMVHKKNKLNISIKAYKKVLTIDNRRVRQFMQTSKTSGCFNLLNMFKTSIFDNTLQRNFSLNVDTVK